MELRSHVPKQGVPLAIHSLTWPTEKQHLLGTDVLGCDSLGGKAADRRSPGTHLCSHCDGSKWPPDVCSCSLATVSSTACLGRCLIMISHHFIKLAGRDYLFHGLDYLIPGP